ncbi:hypothetical protein HJ588_07900 [Flexivirga sp. ID2601S]|uniref:TOMM leader peptide-binding protein n=1 Tax=Flexivirga aerilata TaxID=1656889 RepID=A0A849AI22_9MICO|nr:hypothetical protein [Flexivirga aerilata]NNG39196.1 hypothetical protein [Flexivirga aerilata]
MPTPSSAHTTAADAAPVTAALRPRRHGRGEVLLEGARPGGLVLSGLSTAEATAIVSLGPALQLHRLDGVAASSQRWAAVVAQLHDAARALAPETAPAGHVAVLATGSVPDAVGRALRTCVAQVDTDDLATARLAHPAREHDRPDLVVLPAVDALPPWTAGAWERSGVRQLPVIVSGDRLTVGPLIRPGSGPCLHCLDLHRADRDPSWAAWAATRTAPSGTDAPVGAPPEIAAMAAGLVCTIVRGLVTGEPLPAGVSLSMRSPRPRLLHHLWPVHPACCGSAERQETMTG